MIITFPAFSAVDTVECADFGIVDDDLVESAESFTVTASGGSFLAQQNSIEVNITDNDGKTIESSQLAGWFLWIPIGYTYLTDGKITPSKLVPQSVHVSMVHISIHTTVLLLAWFLPMAPSETHHAYKCRPVKPTITMRVIKQKYSTF